MSTKIEVRSNGSLRIEGDFEIIDAQGVKYDVGDRKVVSLCRCGMSLVKPFCDGAHKGHFEHPSIAFQFPVKQ